METMKKIQFCDAPGIELLCDSCHGAYIPQYFVERFSAYLSELTDEDKNDLSSPANENYWDAWDDVLGMTLTNDDGKKFVLFQHEGDVWAIPEDINDLIDWDNF